MEHAVCGGVWFSSARGMGLWRLIAVQAGRIRYARVLPDWDWRESRGNAGMLPAWGAGIFLGGQPTGINPVARWLR